jgi:hypothetical protein
MFGFVVDIGTGGLFDIEYGSRVMGMGGVGYGRWECGVWDEWYL